MSIRTRKFSQFIAGGAVQDGDIVVGLRNGQNYQFDAFGGGNSGGVIRTITQAGHGLDKEQWVYLDTNGLYQKASATDVIQAEVEGLVLRRDAADPNNKFVLQTVGYVEPGTFTGLTVGPAYFLTNDGTGLMTLTENLINGEVRLPLFVADTPTSGWIRQFDGIVNNGQQPVFSDIAGGNGEPVKQLITQNNAFTPGQVLYNDAANHYALAIADGSIPEAHKAVGIVASSPAPTPTEFTLQQSGYMSGFPLGIIPPGGTDLVPATQYWLSTTTAGALQATEPNTLGHWKKPMVQAASTTTGWVLPQLPLQVTTATANPILVNVNQVAHGFTYHGQVVKPKTNALGEYEAANASNPIGAYGVGMISSISDVDNFVIQESGYITGLDVAPPVPGGIPNPAAPFTIVDNEIGTPFYLSATNAGQITTTQPPGAFYSKPIFMASTAGAGHILPHRPLPSAILAPGASPNIFLGYLDKDNNFSSQTILRDQTNPDVNTNYFGAYSLIIHSGDEVAVNYGIKFSGAPSIAIGIQFFIDGIWQTTAGTYADYLSGVNSTAGINTATLYGHVANGGVGVGRNLGLVLPPISNRVALINGTLTLTAAASSHVATFNVIGVDLSGATPIGYSNTGWCGSDSGVGVATGMRIVSNVGALEANSSSYVAVYGIPNA